MAYVSRHMLPSYYEITSVRRHSLDNMRDDILALEESVEILIKRVDAINNQVDDNEQELMGALKQIEDMQSDIAGHLTRIDDLEGRHD
jgi:predicted  nucleic acid-binding Zn-ribbon protein